MLWEQRNGERPDATRGEPTATPKARAKSVICLFQHGGPSQMDLFDPKPVLTEASRQAVSGLARDPLRQAGGQAAGLAVSISAAGSVGDGAERASAAHLRDRRRRDAGPLDDDRIGRSRGGAAVDSHRQDPGRPADLGLVGRLRAWARENQNLPAYVVLSDPGGLPVDGVRNWSNGWLPAIDQGTPFRSGATPVLNLETPQGVTAEARECQLRFLDELNQSHRKRHPGDTELEARIANFEIAAAMQTAVPEALDLSRESEHTRRMYGLDNPATREYGSRCLIARRLVERGVRFVQLFLSGQPWDTHNKNAETLKSLCAGSDQPSAALVRDLKQRGLLDETIVIWTGEFGRLPVSQGTDGRDHNRHGFSLWLAGGGFKPGYVHGATDDFGYKSVENIVTVHDLQATLLHALGLDHRKLTYPHEGRLDSLTDAEVTKAKVVPGAACVSPRVHD